MRSIINVKCSRCTICCLLLTMLFLFSSRQGKIVGDVYLLNICWLKSKFHVVVIDFNVNCKFWFECQLLKITNHSNFGGNKSCVASGVAEHLRSLCDHYVFILSCWLNFWAFHWKRGFYIKLIAKIATTWLLLCNVPILLTYIMLFWNIL